MINARRAMVLALTLIVPGMLQTATGGEAKPATETRDQRDLRMKWWREARFGMFIHWGLYAIPAGEWNGKPVKSIGEWIMQTAAIPVEEYEKLAPQFNPKKFDAKAWVKLAGDAGMKYIVLTSKHHDGFCLWDSKVSTYDVMDASPFKRDIARELADACKADGRVRMCFYHSIMDWHHPDAQSINTPGNYSPGGKDKDGYKPNPNFPKYFENYLKPQLKELIQNYDPAVMWFDGEWIPEYTEEMGHDLYNYCRSLKPEIIVNNRVGKSRKGMSGMSQSKESAGDFGTPEQEIPATGFPGLDWESCMTMNDTWGYKKDDQNWKSSTTLIRNLIDTASKGGNYLLNVGPTAEGLIPAPSVERLKDVGEWMKANSESIYGTTANPLGELKWGRATQKGRTIYLHVFDWPADRVLQIPVKNKVKKASILGKRGSLDTKQITEGVEIKLPSKPTNDVATVIAVELSM